MQQSKENIVHTKSDRVKTYSTDAASTEITINFEFKLFQMYGPLLGTYAIPNINSIRQWNCIIFIRSGLYKDAKFKFNVIFPQDFPKKSPQIHFLSKLLHPLIHPHTGSVDINNMLSHKWNYANDNMVYNVFTSLKDMLVQKDKLTHHHSFNPYAAKLYNQNYHMFVQKCLESVEESLDKLYVNVNDSSLIIKKYQNGQLDTIKQKLEEICCKNGQPEYKKHLLLDVIFKS